jgi:hypothetical protein
MTSATKAHSQVCKLKTFVMAKPVKNLFLCSWRSAYHGLRSSDLGGVLFFERSHVVFLFFIFLFLNLKKMILDQYPTNTQWVSQDVVIIFFKK